MDFRSDRTVAGLAGSLCRDATTVRGIPAGLARQAERATAKRFAGECREPLDDLSRRRMAAYFDAVVRRRAFCCADPEALAFRRRLVAASIEEDFRRAMRTPDTRRPVATMPFPLPLGV
jgi:hypothetical protein